MQVIGQAGNSITDVPVNGDKGATFFGGWATDSDFLTALTLTCDPLSDGFAIGEFGISSGGSPAIPAPGAVLLGTLGAAFAVWLRRRRLL